MLTLATAAETLLVNPLEFGKQDLTLSDSEKALRERFRESANGITSYNTDLTGDKICFLLGQQICIYQLSTAKLHFVELPETTESIFDPRISPDGKYVAYIDGPSLAIVELAGSANKTLLTTTDENQYYGRADFIAAEEMGRTRGYWWAPNSKGILATKVDESSVETAWITDPANPTNKPRQTKYPFAGTTNPTVELHYTNLEGQNKRINWNRNNEFEYLVKVDWTDDNKILLLTQTRDQTKVEVAITEPNSETEEANVLRTIESETWVDVGGNYPKYVTNKVATIENTGDSYALVVDTQAKTDTSINVRSILDVSENRIIFSGWLTPTEIQLFVFDFEADIVRQLTSEPGIHSAVIHEDHLVVSISTAALATQHRVMKLNPELELEAVTLNGAEILVDANNVEPLVKPLPTFNQVGKNKIETAVFLPENHTGERLPILLDPYGGPGAQRVLKSRNSHLVSQWFANQGFIVVVADGAGTPGRGPKWDRLIYKDFANPTLDDQVSVVETIGDTHEAADTTRVAIRGWSFGGYLAALAVLRRPDIFHAAIVGAPVTDWELYDTHYTERYLGNPNDKSHGYDISSIVEDAAKLTRPLFLIHGLADDNVLVANALKFSSALLAAGADHTVLPLSEVTHMTPQPEVAENLLKLQVSFLKKTLSLKDSTI